MFVSYVHEYGRVYPLGGVCPREVWQPYLRTLLSSTRIRARVAVVYFTYLTINVYVKNPFMF